MEPLVVFDNVSAGYRVLKGFRSLFPRVRLVLHNVSFTAYPGDKLAIIGESGAGKTTIIKILLGLLKPVSGRVLVFGKDLYTLKSSERMKLYRRIGYVPQDPGRSLDPKLQVIDILAEPLEAQGVPWRIIEDKARKVIGFVGLSDKVLDMYPDQLSGGMQQRVLIARALIHDPEVLILDEPTSALDVSIQAQIIKLINKIYEARRLTLILVTHDLAVAQYIADRGIVLRKGIIVEEGALEELIKEPRSEYTRLLVKSYMFE